MTKNTAAPTVSVSAETVKEVAKLDRMIGSADAQCMVVAGRFSADRKVWGLTISDEDAVKLIRATLKGEKTKSRSGQIAKLALADATATKTVREATGKDGKVPVGTTFSLALFRSFQEAYLAVTVKRDNNGGGEGARTAETADKPVTAADVQSLLARFAALYVSADGFNRAGFLSTVAQLAQNAADATEPKEVTEAKPARKGKAK
jgi:hypothetical protein